MPGGAWIPSRVARHSGRHRELRFRRRKLADADLFRVYWCGGLRVGEGTYGRRFRSVCMGIKRARHRHGTGRILIEAAGQFAVSQGTEFLTVKILAPSRPDINYVATRLFYEAVGFLPCSPLPPSSLCDGHVVNCGTALIQINRARLRPRLGHQRWWHLRRYVTNQTIRTRGSWVLSLAKPFAVWRLPAQRLHPTDSGRRPAPTASFRHDTVTFGLQNSPAA